MATKKNCHNCAYLEWIEAEECDPSGWVCNNREYKTTKDETKHFDQLDRESYRLKGKKCFSPSNTALERK